MSTKLPRRGPHKMNGMARMLAQARTLPPLAAQDTQASGRMNDMIRASQHVLAELRKKQLQLANVNVCLDSFDKQKLLLPEEAPLRKVVETLIDTLRKAIEAGEVGASVTVNGTPEAEPV